MVFNYCLFQILSHGYEAKILLQKPHINWKKMFFYSYAIDDMHRVYIAPKMPGVLL